MVLRGLKSPSATPEKRAEIGGIRRLPSKCVNSAAAAIPISLQHGVFRLGILENLDVGGGILPNGQEILISTPGFDPVCLNNVRSAQLQVRQGAYRIGEHDAAVIEDLLKFRGGLLATSCCKVRLTAHIGSIESSEFREQHCTGHREVVWNRWFQSLDRLQR